jgi:hypothetical protein
MEMELLPEVQAALNDKATQDRDRVIVQATVPVALVVPIPIGALLAHAPIEGAQSDRELSAHSMNVSLACPATRNELGNRSTLST